MNQELIQIPSLEEVFSPRSVAIIGVSGSGKLGFAEMVLLGHLEIGNPNVYPVNPKYDKIFDTPCYPSILDIPGPVDHVVVNIPAGSVLDLLHQCARKKVKSVHFFTAGFGESGLEDRVDLEQQMLKIAREGGFRIIGPNCVGLFIPKARTINTLGIPFDAGPIGFISQSGGHANNLPNFSALRGLRFSKVVSYGNALDVDEIELLDYLSTDDETTMIGAYIEGVKKGRDFFSVLNKAASRKPVIVYKGGKTEAGLRAAKGHTASMISSIDVFNAVCRQANAIQVDNLDEMIDVMTALRFLKKIPTGKNVALFGSGGGPSVLAGDEMETCGLTIPRFSNDIQTRLKSVLPVDGGIFMNPLDTVNLIDPEAIAAAFNVLCKSDEVDILVYHMGFHPIGMWGIGRFSEKKYLDQLIQTMVQARETGGKPILLALRPAQDLTAMKEFLEVQKAFVDSGFPVFHSLGNLALAVNRIIDWKDRIQ
ncbi:CoA-binding protein [bacterium]|nr:CoA-binding protein [bacterium]